VLGDQGFDSLRGHVGRAKASPTRGQDQISLSIDGALNGELDLSYVVGNDPAEG